jgi:plastocyanin
VTPTAAATPTTAPTPTTAKGTPTSKAALVTIQYEAGIGFDFTPASLTIKQGQTVRWRNDDIVGHNVESDLGVPAEFYGDLPGKGTFSFTFTVPGTYPYSCTIHPSMRGTIIVTP